jgi:hypothetical protein
MASTVEKPIVIRNNTKKLAFPVKSGESIYHGCIALVKIDGYMYNHTSSIIDPGQIKYLGLVYDETVNTNGLTAATTADGSILGQQEIRSAVSGDATVRTLYLDGQFYATMSGLTQANCGDTVYATDNFTFALTGTVAIGKISKVLAATLAEIDLNFTPVFQSDSTAGSLISTGSAWIDHSIADSCAFKLLTSYSAATGEFATMRLRAKSLSVAPVVGINSSASAGQNDYGNLLAVQGYAQANAYTQSSASNILCGIYSCVDRTVSSSGRSWSMWTDDHSNAKAAAGHYLHRLSNNSTNSTVYDGIWTIYAGAGCSNLINFEGTNAPVESGDATGGTKSYKIAVKVNGVDGYFQWYAK